MAKTKLGAIPTHRVNIYNNTTASSEEKGNIIEYTEESSISVKCDNNNEQQPVEIQSGGIKPVSPYFMSDNGGVLFSQGN